VARDAEQYLPLMAHRDAPQVTAPQIGAHYVQAGLWRCFAIRDGNLITGQQSFSGEQTARPVLDRWADSHAGPSCGSLAGTFVSSCDHGHRGTGCSIVTR